MSFSEVVLELCDKGALLAALCLIAWQWTAAMSLATVDPATLIRDSYIVLYRSRQLMTLTMALIAVFVTLLDCISERHWMPLPFGLLGITLLVASTVLLPPSIMMLGVSRSAETRRFVCSVAWRIAPLRIVHFLVAEGLAADPLFNFSNGRARIPYRWQDSVKLCGSFVCIVLIDARVSTDPVEEEAMATIEPHLIARSVFVGEQDSPVLERIEKRLGVALPALRVAPEEQVSRWMRQLRRETLRKNAVERGSVAERILIATRRSVRPRTSRICEELRQKMAQSTGLTAKDIGEHIEKCAVCKLDPRLTTMTSLHTEQAISSSAFPFTVTIGLEGLMDWDLFRKVAIDPEAELIILSSNSPAARHPRWCIDVAKLFALDSQLGLVIEKCTLEPITFDPVVAVRRKLAESWGPQPLLLHLDEVARALATHVTASGYKVRYEPLIELPRRAQIPGAKL